MARKIRLNVVCTSREKRFLVIAEAEWSLESLRQCIEDVFHRLYRPQHQLRIAALQNEFHFDMPLDYKVCDALDDAGLIFAVEEKPNFGACKKYWNSITFHSSSCSFEDSSGTDSEKETPNQKRPALIEKNHGSRAKVKSKKSVPSSSVKTCDNGASSVHHVSCDDQLKPQLIESICEETEVDIETIDGAFEEDKISVLTSSSPTPSSTKRCRQHAKNLRKSRQKQQIGTKKVKTV